MHDELAAAEPRRARERELARRGDVGADPFLGQEPEHATFGSAFVPKNTRPSPTAARSARALARIVPSQRTTSGVPMLLREGRRVDPREGQAGAVESRGVGEQR